jgi:hypothetical protein
MNGALRDPQGTRLQPLFRRQVVFMREPGSPARRHDIESTAWKWRGQISIGKIALSSGVTIQIIAMLMLLH